MKKVTITFLVNDTDPCAKLINGAQEIEDSLVYLFGESFKGGVTFDAIDCTDVAYEVGEFYIPQRMFRGLRLYIEKRVPIGDFLRAVLSNDLTGAVLCADDVNIRNLPAYVYYLYNEAPAGCWGSVAKVEKWLNIND